MGAKGQGLPSLVKLLKPRWLAWGYLAGLFSAGVVAWLYFFSRGRFPFTFHDWADITGPRLAILRDAILRGTLPLYVVNTHPLNHITDQFLAIPDQVLSPQVLLLPFLSLGQFVLLDVLLLYALGFLGLLWLQRKFSLSALPFGILFILFNFNGYILAHLSVGHLTWAGYFLMPWFAALVFQLLEGQGGWAWILKTALLLFAVYLQGSFHQFVWSLIFLALLAVVSIGRRRFWTVTGGAVFAILLSMVRILPSAIISSDYTAENYGGYGSLEQIGQSLVTIYPTGVKTLEPGMVDRLGYWEFSLYIGLLGTAFLLYFGIWRWLRRQGANYRALLLPLVGLLVFSIGAVFEWVRKLPIPLIQGERVSSRMIMIPFVFLIFLAVIELQRWLEARPRLSRWFYTAAGVLAGLEALDLWQNLSVWRVVRAFPTFTLATFDPQVWQVAIRPLDSGYALRLWAGAGITVLTLAGLVFLAWRRPSPLAPLPIPGEGNKQPGREQKAIQRQQQEQPENQAELDSRL
jgi:hypothetical protein